MYATAKPTSRAELINLAVLIRGEFARIHTILDEMNQRLSKEAAQRGWEGE